MAVRALLVGSDRELTLLRSAVLLRAGVDVTPCDSEAEAELLLKRGRWDALIVCLTLGDCTALVRDFHLHNPDGRVSL